MRQANIVEPSGAHDVAEEQPLSDDTLTETDNEEDIDSDTDSDETSSFDMVCEPLLLRFR